MMPVYVLDALRTPLAARNKELSRMRPEEFGARLLRCLCQRHDIRQVDGILGGNAVGTGGNLARLMALTAGLPEEIPACTVDTQCASAAAAFSLGYAQIASGLWDTCIAGGMESISLQPLRTYSPKDPRYRETARGDGSYYMAQFSPGELSEKAMLQGAERVANSEGVSRRELDRWALLSHRRALAAQESKLLADSVVPVGECGRDDGPRPSISEALLERMPPLLGPHGVTTAGNSCHTMDGAAFALLVSGRWLEHHPGAAPKAQILSAASRGCNPLESPRGAMETADFLLGRMGLSWEDLSAIEFNEAFAVIDVLFERSHPHLTDRYNRLGGALAYGHPYGASGAVLLVHLLRSLDIAGGGKGLLSIAGAGGMGNAVLLETCR